MTETHQARRREVALYIERANEALEVAAHNLDDGFYAASVNRAYYAVFYAANAMLSTQGLTPRKHSDVSTAASSQRFASVLSSPGLLRPNTAESTDGLWMTAILVTMILGER